MKRRWKVLLTLAVVLAALLGINKIVIDSQTKRAEVTAEGGQILELSSVDLQVVDQPPTDPANPGQAIVLLHCHGCSLHWWDRFVPLINEHHRVIRFDLIGHGGSEKPKSGYSIEDQAAAVAEGLNGLGVEGATVVGHSLGGAVATALAEQSSQLVDRIVLISTAPTTDAGKLPLLARLSSFPVLGQALWRARAGFLVKSGYGSAFAPGFDFEAAFDDPDQVVTDNSNMTFTSSREAASAFADYVDAEPMAARLAATGVPLLVILGSEDQIVDTTVAEEDYGTVPGATVKVLDGVGHSAQLEAPKATAKAVLHFSDLGVVAPPPKPTKQSRPPRRPKPPASTGKQKQPRRKPEPPANRAKHGAGNPNGGGTPSGGKPTSHT